MIKEKEKKIEIPEEVEELFVSLDEKECFLLACLEIYKNENGRRDISKIPYEIIKELDGPIEAKKRYDKIKNLRHDISDTIYKYLYNTGAKTFDLNNLTIEERKEYISKLANLHWPCAVRYDSENNYMLRISTMTKEEAEKYVNYEILYKTFDGICTLIINSINANKKEITPELKALEDKGCITIVEKHIKNENKSEIKEIDSSINSSDISPENNDIVYYTGVLTKKGRAFVEWFGVEIPEHIPPKNLLKQKGGRLIF